MKVWVKEYGNEFKIGTVLRWVRKGIPVEIVTKHAEIATNDFVLYTVGNKSITKETHPDNAVPYENVFQSLAVRASKELVYNFDL